MRERGRSSHVTLRSRIGRDERGSLVAARRARGVERRGDGDDQRAAAVGSRWILRDPEPCAPR
jgi:hypothetical protein